MTWVLWLSGKFREEWRNRLRRCDRVGRFPVQTPLGARPGLGTQPCYEDPGDFDSKQCS